MRPLHHHGPQLIASRGAQHKGLVHDVLASPPDLHKLVIDEELTHMAEVEPAWRDP